MKELNILPLRPSGAPHATTPSPESLSAALLEKERAVVKLRGTAAARGQLMEGWRRQVEALRIESAARQQTEQRLWAEIHVRHQAEDALRAQLLAVTNSRAWRFLQRLRRWGHAIAPPDSRRGRALGLFVRAVRAWYRDGLRAVARKVVKKCARPLVRLLGLRRKSPAAPGIEPIATRDLLGTVAAPTPRPAPLPPLAASDGALLTAILGLPPRGPAAPGKPIDVIVPVYKGLTETLRCLQTVLTAKTTIAHEVVVINDASPDLLLADCLRRIARKGLLTFLDNPENLGFVQTVNRGIALHPERDVLLLNSDTEVYGDWLDRLHRAAYAAKDVGTVTPLSNNATICSYPRFCEDNPIPADLTPDRLDALCASLNGGEYVDVPTAVGFCMYIRRDCLDKVGAFDAAHFGKGYGEENDFCMRALRRGWRHLLTADTFVRHLGGTSFGTEKNPAVERALRVLDALHPDYFSLVGAHLLENPALGLRRRLDLARLADTRPTILYVTHNRGGGTERHVVDMAVRLEGEGCRALVLRPVDAGHVRLEEVTGKDMPNLVFAIPEEYWTLRETLLDLGIEHIHIQHTIGVHAEVLTLLGGFGVPYDYTVHDYYPVCPRINLIDESGTYCGEPEPSQCNACLEKNGTPLGGENPEIGQWRQAHAAWLAGARKAIVPHRDVALRLAKYFPEIEFTERRHLEAVALARPVGVRFAPGEVLRVAVIGMIGKHKGSELLLECARDAAARSLPIHFHVVGFTDQDPDLRPLPTVSITGAYGEEEVFNLLEPLRCHCAFFPSVWPETYSYVLSIALLGRLFPIAFDLGAPAARIRESGVGHVFPLTTEAAAINDELLSLTDRLVEPLPQSREELASYPTLLTDYYGLTWKQSQAA